MVTGDHLLTAIHVAKQVGILKDPDYVVVRGVDGLTENRGKILCVEGDPSAVISAGLADRVAVWARATPQHKQDIVAGLSLGKKLCLFCGDGTNDVAALKQAGVGVALMTSSPTTQSAISQKLRKTGIVGDSSLPAKPGDASIAAPFAYHGDTIRCVPLLVRSGRAALALMIQNYKILAVNSLITAFCLSVLTLRGVKLGDSQTAVEALLLSILSFMFSRCPPAKSLPVDNGKFKPVKSVFQSSVMVSIFGQALLHLVLLAYGQFMVTPTDSALIDLDKKFEPNIGNTVAFLQLWSAHLSSTIANFEGPPSLPSLSSSHPVMVLIIGMISTILLLAGGLLPGDLLELVDIEPAIAQDLVKLVLAHIGGGLLIGVGIRKFLERP
jgi:cation-transporting ATPase 13A1